MENKKRKNPFRFLPMDIGRLVCSILMLTMRPKRLHVSGRKYDEKLQGGAIVVSNHTGFADPFRVGTCFWYRRLFFLAAKEIMFNPILTVLLKGMGCIRIDREQSDIDAIRKCVSTLKDGKLVGIFPQGGIERDDNLDKIKSGAVLIAMQAGVPIIPMYTAKRRRWWQRQLSVVGDPFDCREHCQKKFPSVADMEHLSEELLQKMEECKKVYEQQIG